MSNESIRFMVGLPADLLKLFDEKRKKTNRSRASLIRQWINEYVSESGDYLVLVKGDDVKMIPLFDEAFSNTIVNHLASKGYISTGELISKGVNLNNVKIATETEADNQD